MIRKAFHPSFLFLILIALTMVARSNAGGIVVYWGQDEREGSLTKTCSHRLYQIVNIAFLSVFGNGRQPEMNLAGHCDPSSNGCQKLSTDIKNCQKRGIKVLLSIGGGELKYSFSSAEDARKVADYIWNNFLGGKSSSRPLGDAVLDGVDFDIEGGGGQAHYAELARRLNQHDQGGRKLYFTAAPQCPFPDINLKEALSTRFFDHIWVQFYNNPPCQFHSGNPKSFRNSWSQWISSVKPSKFSVGVPASRSAADAGFVPTQSFISQVLPFVKRSSKYGGVMLWDRFHDLKDEYSSRIKSSV